MPLFAVLALLFVVLPVAELALLLRVGGVIGFWPTLSLVLLTGVVGAALARAQGFRAVATIQGELAAGRVPGGALLDGACILAGGVLLLTPGFITDSLGFALLVPPTRRVLQRWISGSVQRGISRGTIHVSMGGMTGRGWGPPPGGPGAQRPSDPPVIEAEVVESRMGEGSGHRS